MGESGGSATRPLSVAEVTEVVRHVVRELAPEELDVVDPVADAWVSGEFDGLRRKRAPGAAVGSGVEAVLLTQMLFPIVAGAVGDVLGTVALEPGRLKRRKSRSAAGRQGAGKQGPDKDSPDKQSADQPSPPVRLTGQQVKNLHDACQRHARALGLSAARAAVLADAVVGSLDGAGSDRP